MKGVQVVSQKNVERVGEYEVPRDPMEDLEPECCS